MSGAYSVNDIFNGFLTGMICPYVGTTTTVATTTDSDPPGWVIANGQERTNGVDGRYNALLTVGLGSGTQNGNFTPVDLRASDLRGTGTKTYNNGNLSVDYSGPSLKTYAGQKMQNHNHTATLASHTHNLKVKLGAIEYDVTAGEGTVANPTFGLLITNGTTVQNGYDSTAGELNLYDKVAMNVGNTTPGNLSIANNTVNTSAQIYPVNYGVHWIIKL
jgi:hypothetical protein